MDAEERGALRANLLQTCVNVGIAGDVVAELEGMNETTRDFVSCCKQEAYGVRFGKRLKSLQMLGNLTFYRTSGFHRVFHRPWNFRKPANGRVFSST